jgi:hypothetical protein
MHITAMNKNYLNNPIKILHHLKEAEAQVEIFTDYLEHNLATKKDLLILEERLEARITMKTATIVGSIVGFFYLLERFF